MSERLERLQREIAAEKAAVLAELGLVFDSPLVVVGGQDVSQAIGVRLQSVPEMLRKHAAEQLQRRVIFLPWLRGRRVDGTRTDHQFVGLPSGDHQHAAMCSAGVVLSSMKGPA